MDNAATPEYNIRLSFQNVNLPPATDILVLGRQYPHGKNGVLQAFKYIAPDEFECIEENDHDIVSVVFVSRRILKKISIRDLRPLLQQYVYPYVSIDEAVKVDVDIVLIHKNIKGVMT